jgi:hypothetical protein
LKKVMKDSPLWGMHLMQGTGVSAQ